MLRVAANDAARAELAVGWMTSRGRGAQRMLAAALEAEVEAYLATHLEERDGAGRRLVAGEAATGEHGSRGGRGARAAGG